jgi:prophage regulatory protein
MDNPNGRRIIRKREVIEKTGLSESTLRRRTQDAGFPAPVSLGDGAAIGWYLDEIDAWLESRPRVRFAPRADSPQAA